MKGRILPLMNADLKGQLFWDYVMSKPRTVKSG